MTRPRVACVAEDAGSAGRAGRPGRFLLGTVHTCDDRPCTHLRDSWASRCQGQSFVVLFLCLLGKKISAPESSICCHYCNQMIPGNKYLHHMVSSN